LVTALTLVSVLSTAAAIWFYLRGRRAQGVPRDEVHELLLGAPDLRGDLDDAAHRITRQLRNVLDCGAVGITDGQGNLLDWEGGANYHYPHLTEAIAATLDRGVREVVTHETVPCPRRGRCVMGTAVTVPVIVEGTVEAVLIVVGRSRRRPLIAMADRVAEFVGTLFELDRMAESKLALLRAEVRASRAQISPHFLYNALNTIAELTRKDPDKAQDLLFELADFTRYSFRASGSFTTLAEELHNVDRYLTIEAAHYAGRLSVRVKVDPGVLNVVVPFLIVQPLVENAVKHGLAGKPGGGTVTIIAEDAGPMALISVDDDGVGMDADRLFADLHDAHRTGSHVGIGNVNQRMRSVFGDDYALMVETAPDAGMKVILRVPKFVPGVRTDMRVFGR
jgi:two-component system, LytTR family, sensor kinase